MGHPLPPTVDALGSGGALGGGRSLGGGGAPTNDGRLGVGGLVAQASGRMITKNMSLTDSIDRWVGEYTTRPLPAAHPPSPIC